MLGPILSMQGLDAINAVGRAAVGVATSLDNAIEELMHNWASPLAAHGSPSSHRRELAAARSLRTGSGAKGGGDARVPPDGVQQGLTSLLAPKAQVDFLADLWAPSFDSFVAVKQGSQAQHVQQQDQRRQGDSGKPGLAGAQAQASGRAKEVEKQAGSGAQEPESPATPQRSASLSSPHCGSSNAVFHHIACVGALLTGTVHAHLLSMQGCLPPVKADLAHHAFAGSATDEARLRTTAVQEEVESMRVQQGEFLRLRRELHRLRSDLSSTSHKCTALAQENSVLREQMHDSPGAPDPIADQVSCGLSHLRKPTTACLRLCVCVCEHLEGFFCGYDYLQQNLMRWWPGAEPAGEAAVGKGQAGAGERAPGAREQRPAGAAALHHAPGRGGGRRGRRLRRPRQRRPVGVEHRGDHCRGRRCAVC